MYFDTHLLVEGLGLERLDGSGNPGLHMGGYMRYYSAQLADIGTPLLGLFQRG